MNVCFGVIHYRVGVTNLVYMNSQSKFITNFFSADSAS